MKKFMAVVFGLLCLLVQVAAPGGSGQGQTDDRENKLKNTLEFFGFEVAYS